MVLSDINIKSMDIIGTQVINIRIDNTKLEAVKSIKCLGIIINNKLKFGEHLNYMCKKEVEVEKGQFIDKYLK